MEQEQHFQALDSSLLSSHYLEELDDEAFWRLARAMASQREETRQAPEEGREYLVFSTSQTKCLLPVQHLVESSLGPASITPVPHMPDWVRGITLWRDTILPVADLLAFLWPSASYREELSQIIVQTEEATIALLTPRLQANKHVSRIHPLGEASGPILYPDCLSGVYHEANSMYLIFDLSLIVSRMIQSLHIRYYDRA